MTFTQNFNRIEKKYMVANDKYEQFLSELKRYLTEDQYGQTTICNIYFDTPNYEIINSSLSKPKYKEKLRLRSYGVPNINDTVFVEIKKKYNGVVYKRRVAMKLQQFYRYFYLNENPIIDNYIDRQILSEIDFFKKRYDLKNETFLSYDRIALLDENNKDFRVTFDSNITMRQNDTNLEHGLGGLPIHIGNSKIMEVKTVGALPLWFVSLLSKYQIKPCSFSKYGEAYKEYICGGATAWT